MIYKLVSHVGDESFAALVGTDPEDKFILNTSKTKLYYKKRVVGRKLKQKNKVSNSNFDMVHQSTTAIGYSAIQVNRIFQQWKNSNFYAFVKNNHELHDYAFLNKQYITNKVRPELIRRFSVRPLLVVNLKIAPRAMDEILKLNPKLLLLEPVITRNKVDLALAQ